MTELDSNIDLITDATVVIKSVDTNKNDDFSPGNFRPPQDKTTKFFNLMKYERLRLITFILSGHQWPKTSIVSSTQLAKAGFFYLRDDSVQCAFCKGIVSNWENGDDALEEHKRHFPNCSFVLNHSNGNVPVESDSVIESHVMKEQTLSATKRDYNKCFAAMYPRFNDVEIRKKTFEILSSLNQFPIDPIKFAEAGFYYCGKEDYTRCFQCGGVLHNWKAEDDPIEEHVSFFPDCKFVLSTKGELFYEFVKFKKQLIQLRHNTESPEKLINHDVDCMKKISYQNFIEMKKSAEKLYQKLEQSAKTNNQEDGGFDFYKKYLSKFSFFFDCQKLFNHLQGMNYMSDKTTKLFSLESEENSSTEKVGNLNCIICFDNQIQVVFLPCGHQLACLTCSQKMQTCPICRKEIESKLRTYFP